MQIFLFIVPFAFGLFYEFTSYFSQIFLLIILAIILKRRKRLRCYVNISSLSILLIVLGYLATCVYAVDKGMAFLGFLKFSTLITFTIIIMQYKPIQIKKMLNAIPLSGIIMIVLSVLFKIVPFLPDAFFLTNGRMSGFFEYSNTFALFLLIGIIILLNSTFDNKKKIIGSAIILIGIFVTGSRLVFLLTVLNYIIFIIKLKPLRKPLIGILGAGIIVTALYVLVTNNFNTIGRYLTTSINSSTFLGRILYYKDAIPLIMQNPLGLGYMGYCYMQPVIQTGVYSTVYIHNDLLQIMLDVGVIPAIVFTIAIIKSLINKDKFDVKKQLLLTIVLHMLFDFDLQFVSIFFILIMTLKLNKGKRSIWKIKLKPLIICEVIIGFIYLYFGICTILHYVNQSEMAIKMYPIYTDANSNVIYNSSKNNIEYANKVATKALETNNNLLIAHKVKALYYMENMQWKLMITSKQKSLELSKYDISNYEEYVLMLSQAMTAYINNKNIKEAENCIKQVVQVPSKIEEVKNSTSDIAYKIKDTPNFELSTEIQEYIEKMKGE